MLADQRRQRLLLENMQHGWHAGSPDKVAHRLGCKDNDGALQCSNTSTGEQQEHASTTTARPVRVSATICTGV